jgi:cyclopropane fatty-acyl-phospholipid synthase-like methyltransferase
MAENCLADSNSSVLEIGCGNGDFLAYLSNVVKCKRVVGVTYSEEQQSYVSSKGNECVLVSDIYKIPESFYGKFDAVIFNGAMENFIGNKERNIEFSSFSLNYNEIFEKIKKCLNPNSKKKRVVVTCIHLHRKLAPYEYLQGYLLNRTYGITYPNGIVSHVNSAKMNELIMIKEENRTIDYYLASRRVWYNILLGLQDITKTINMALDIPVFALNDPYYFHKVLHISIQTWPGQFDLPFFCWPMAYDNTPMTQYKWLVFSG